MSSAELMWYRYKDKLPEEGREVIVCSYTKDKRDIQTSLSILEKNRYRKITDQEGVIEKWWRYTIPSDFPPKEIKVGDVFIHIYNKYNWCRIIGKYKELYWCVDKGDNTYSWTKEELLMYYEREE